jgi:tRNA(Ile)-lysidine synthase
VSELLEKLRQTIEAYRLFSTSERVLVGCSGGVDSVVLLHALHNLVGYNLVLYPIYVNYGLRPEENRAEVELLQKISNLWGLSFREVKVDLLRRLREKPDSLQLVAREERYRIFEELRRELAVAKIALAHHADDQAETILYRIIRGTGPDGLEGIPIRRGAIVRPLLEVNRSAILKYADENGLQWVEDSSNQKKIYMRNRIRHELLPLLEREYNPRLREALLRLGGIAGEQRRLLESLAQGATEQLVKNEPGRAGIELRGFLTLEPSIQFSLLKLTLAGLKPPVNLESIALTRLRERIVHQNVNLKRSDLHRRAVVYYEGGRIWLGSAPQGEKTSWQRNPLQLEGRTCLPETGFVLEIRMAAQTPSWNDLPAAEAYFNLDEMKDLPLAVRFWQPGDSFRPLGASGEQKLHDFFIDHKVPRLERYKIPLIVTAEDRIVWVAGWRLSEEFKVRPGTGKPIYHIKLGRENGA